MSTCSHCGRDLCPDKEYTIDGTILCEERCMEEQTVYRRKTHYQDLGSIKTNYLVPARPAKRAAE